MRLKDYPDAIAFYDRLREQRPLEKHEWERQRELKKRYSQAKGQAAYRAKIGELHLQRNREWRKKNKKAIARRAKKAYDENPGWMAAKARKYRQTHPELRDKENARKRRAHIEKKIREGKLLLLPPPEAYADQYASEATEQA